MRELEKYLAVDTLIGIISSASLPKATVAFSPAFFAVALPVSLLVKGFADVCV